jgi:hypothetical protein
VTIVDGKVVGVTVIYSITTAATAADILQDMAPLEGEPIVKASADKFFKPDWKKF